MITNIDSKLVIFGMSCSGKTTFAKSLTGHRYYCFDAMFNWHCIETFGLSIEANLSEVRDSCVGDKWVLDGWHLADHRGHFLPKGSSVCVVYATYERIIGQYRVPVDDFEQHRRMFKKWYHEVDYEKLPATRYFLNGGEFEETSRTEFVTFLERNR